MKKISLNGIWNMTGNGFDCNGTVPGSVYSFLLDNGLMKDPYYRQNELEATPLMEYDYTFSRSFSFDKAVSDTVLLCCDGLDTICDIFLNGQAVGHTQNMHRSYEFDVTQLLKEENDISLVFRSANRFFKEAHAKDPLWGNRDTLVGFNHLRKSFCMSGWDWGPRLPDAGIWKNIYLLVADSDRIDDVRILQRHENGKVWITADVTTVRASSEIRVSLISPDGKVSEIPANTEYEIEEPKLWWPNGLGEQPLYRITVSLIENGAEVDKLEKTVGLRTLKLVREKDKYGISFCHEVNGVRFFAMGADYIPEDAILSRVTPERTEKLLRECKDCNFNAIRVWGGGNYPNDDFFDSCDRFGLVVFFDLMMACAHFPDDPEITEEFAQEVRENLTRIRHHACLAVISGNNECEPSLNSSQPISRIHEKYLEVYEDLVPSIIEEICPEIPYVPSSPSSCGHFIDPQNENVGDTHYWQVWHGDKPFSEYRNHYFRYLSEFGFESFPDEKTVNSFTLPSDRNVFSRVMEMHQRCMGANQKIIAYLSQTYRYPTDFGVLIYASQLLQAEAMRYAVEHLRRNRGRCMGALYWQLNDLWPVASWASIDYYGRFKALQYAAKRFYAPVMISCCETGETTTRPYVVMERDWYDYATKAQLSVNNDTLEPVNGTVRWRLCDRGGKVILSGEKEITVPPLSVVTLDELDFNKTDVEHNYLWYEFDGSDSKGSVIFTAPKHFEFDDPHLTLRRDGDTIHITAQSYAQKVNIYSADEDFVLEDNFFDMEAGERTVKIIEGDPKNLCVRSVYDIR